MLSFSEFNEEAGGDIWFAIGESCKWLLRMHHLVGDELPLTQEFLAQMMGVPA
jgi:hypothetical protein